MPRSEGALAVALLGMARGAGAAGVIHVAGSDGRLESLAALLWALAPDVETYLFPPWDCLPYDRTSPSPRPMGLRVATLSALAEGRTGPWLALTTAEALVQRVPPRGTWAGRTRILSVGDPIDPAGLAGDLAEAGYMPDERVDEPGEIAVRGAVIDVFPAGYYLPVRIDHEDGRVTGIASFDAATQRTTDAFSTLRLQPVSEAIIPGDPEHGAEPRQPGAEHRLPEIYDRLETLFDYAPQARFALGPGIDDRAEAFWDEIRDAYESRLRFDRGERRPLAPDRLYLAPEQRARLLDGRPVTRLEAGGDVEDGPDIPAFAVQARPGDALRCFVAAERAAGRRVLVAGRAEGPDLDSVSERVGKAAGAAVAPVAAWDEVTAAPPGAVLRMPLPLSEGFRAEPDVTVIAVRDVVGSRAASALTAAAEQGPDRFGEDAERFHLGDAVIHLDHGIGILRGLETVEAAGSGGATDTIRLEYAGGSILMVPTGEIEMMWRYGAMRDGLSLDRLGGDSWPKRRATVEAEIGEAARALARLAATNRETGAPRLVPPRRDYERFVARFPFAETPDQRAAVSDILRDLASGRVMDRLCCGDVGFGKTEVALRAAAAAVLAGRQVAVAAPTTVLVRQHLESFRRRFADLGIEVAHLSRLVAPAEAREVKDGLRSGRIRLVVGTQALAGRGVAFADLGLLVVDEEQRFGAADKEKLRRLGRAVHVLTLTATPIPRTMQAALAGLRAVSVLSTPPAARQPVRTVLMPMDEASVRDALLRERRRGGQSFVVCPRIEDIAPMAERLGRIVPELSLRIAHGKLKANEIDETMVRFGDGIGDVLLATNIIESGLDVPRANTILIWRADRFGLAQLHQLRGRVGRGRLRGTAYLLTDPDATLPAETAKRLERLAALDRLGAGFAISAEDLDSRGGGDLLGDTQTGHVKLIGAGLYRRLLERALLMARGKVPADEWNPELNVGAAGRIPESYVPEPEVRLNLYRKIAATRDAAGEERLAEEIEDRFGPRPEEVGTLLGLARLRRLCRAAAVARADAGPQAIALTFKEEPEAGSLEPLAALAEAPPAWKDGRLILAGALPGRSRLEATETVLAALAG